MAIKNFPNEAAYEAAVKPTIESQVAMIENTKAVKYDGVNVIADVPQVGDAVFLDENNKPIIISSPTLIKANVPSAWTYVGEVLEVVDNEHVCVVRQEKTTTRKWLNVCQYAWTDVILTGEETTKTIGIRCALNWSSDTTVTCVYTATTLDEAAAAMQSAIETRLTELSATSNEIALWHCYADADNNRVIVQRDACSKGNYIYCSGLTEVTLSGIPEGNTIIRGTETFSIGEAGYNLEKNISYFSSSGSTPTSDVPLNSIAVPVNRSSFNNSIYCATLRQTFGTYENYIEKQYYVKFPQQSSTFGLPDGKTMTSTYGNVEYIKKNGEKEYKFPIFHYVLTVGFNADGLRQGDWYLCGLREMCMIFSKDILKRINSTREKMGVSIFTTTAFYILAQRFNINRAWYTYHQSATISGGFVNDVYSTYIVLTNLKFR